MKVFKKKLCILLIMCITMAVCLLGACTKTQDVNKVSQESTESVEEKEKREEEEKKKQEEEKRKEEEEKRKAEEEKRKAEEEKRKAEEEKRKQEEEKKKEEERQKLEEQKKKVLQRLSGEWKLSYIYYDDGEKQKLIEYKSKDERGFLGVVLDAGIEWLKSKDSLLSKLLGFGGEAILSGKEPVYIDIDVSSIDVTAIRIGEFDFADCTYEYDDVSSLFSWADENETGFEMLYDEENKWLFMGDYINGEAVDYTTYVFEKK